MAAQRILVIDDEPDVLTLCQRVLEEEGFEVAGALTGEEGLRLLKGQSFDLTLLDVRLPDRDGLDVLSMIQEMDLETDVVIITGYGTMEMVSALKSGAQDFLLKPFTPEELVTSVQKVLEKERLIQENLRLKARLPILEVSQALMSEVNLERLTQLALETVRQTLRADRVSLMLLDEEQQELSISAALGRPDEVVATTRVKVWQSLAGLAAQRRQPILLPEQAESDPAIQARRPEPCPELVEGPAEGSAICLPLIIKDHVLGVLNASRTVGGIPFRQDDVNLLCILGGQIAVAIENAQLFEQAQREIAERKRAEWTLGERLKELTCLYAVHRDMQEQLSIDELCRRVIEHLVPAMQFPEITVPVIELDDKRFTCERYTEGLSHGLCAEIRVGGEARGYLWVYYAEGRPFLTPEEQNLCNAIAEALGLWLERKRTEEALQQHAERLRTLATQLAEVEEAERQRLARELHDQVGQNLTALGINLSIVRSQIPEEAADLVRSRLDDSVALVEQTTERIRSVMTNLRPPVLDDYGLVATLRWYGEQFASRTGIAVNVRGEEPDPRLPTRVENALFRISQEALTNVTKHAQATQVMVAVEVDDETIRLVVADNGIGFDPTRLPASGERRGWGLLTMTERAEAVGGRLRVESVPREGTRVVVEVPITDNTAKKRTKSDKS